MPLTITCQSDFGIQACIGDSWLTDTSVRRLVSDDILRLVHGGARMVYVGKQAGFHTRSQEQIHELLCEFASAGHKVRGCALCSHAGVPYSGIQMLSFSSGLQFRC